jgi:pimeloyl-ACP methyl ester carboxylesterase
MLERIDRPVDVVALSLGSEFTALAALEAQDQVRSLALISPTGFQRSSETAQNALKLVSDATRRGSEALSRVGSVAGPQTKNLEAGVSAAGDVTRFIQSGKVSDIGYKALTLSLWARPIYDLLTLRPTIQHYLGKSFAGSVPHAFVDYAYKTAHQPGAHHAPLSFISGRLFTPNVREAVYDQITLPTLVLYNEDPYVTFEALPAFLSQRVTWQAERIRGTQGLPHWEQLIATTRALDGFWAAVDEGAPERVTVSSADRTPQVPEI